MADGEDELEVELPRDVSRVMYLRIKDMVKKLKTNKVILLYLADEFGCTWSLATLKRRLLSMKIKRHDNTIVPREVINAVQIENRGAGQMIGYRHMQQRLRLRHDLLVKRDDVYQAMLYVDPEAMIRRKDNVLKRRDYVSVGSNWIWHVDGHDKIKPFGFAIHGCIDGFSRMILWCRVDVTNNDPAYIARYFYDFVKTSKVVPAMTRSDGGTENGLLAACQMYLRRNGIDSTAGTKSHVYGGSMSNQRIERYWRHQREHHSQYWESEFRALEQDGYLIRDNLLHKKCLQFVYMPLMRKEVFDFVEEHNSHRIRKQKDRLTPQGIPEDLYRFPDQYGFRQAGFEADEDDLEVISNENAFHDDIPHYLTNEFCQAASFILPMEITLENAKDAYITLQSMLDSNV